MVYIFFPAAGKQKNHDSVGTALFNACGYPPLPAATMGQGRTVA